MLPSSTPPQPHSPSAEPQSIPSPSTTSGSPPHLTGFLALREVRKLPSRASGCVHREMPGTCTKHHDYYFDDGNVIFEVQGVLYKLHRPMLQRHSPVFRELFMMPQPQGTNEGLSEQNPIVLEGIDPVNFGRLLSLLYPSELGGCEIATVDEWMSVFDQADRWQMESLRDHALNQLKTTYIKPIHKILFWTRYHLPEKEIVQSFVDLISRPDSLSLAEANEVGLEMLVKIARARDMARDEGLCPRSGGFSVKRDEALARIVHQVFFQ